MTRLPRTFLDRTRDLQRLRDVHFCQHAVFALVRAGADRSAIRAAQRDLAEARQDRRWSR